ncbi:hypothetical protein FSP39_020633 [Pinctada imbricata]|uniref:RING-type E3 ubiquitin transferase n=1 Tax=Pinctada imbricata TaxID=66713 RepID=A0AA89BJP0_PINIB|nr:hypothetical protein FSP39_020633 [Pinctada imbricata]
MRILDAVDIGSLVGIGIDALVAYALYRYHKSSARSVDEVKRVECHLIGPELVRELEKQPDRSLPYVCIDGFVSTVGNDVRSHYGDQRGVLQNISLIEHKSKRSNGVWTDAKNIIRDVWESVPFYLRSMVHEEPRILIIDPRSAKYLEEDLTTTYDKFEPSKTGIVQRGIDRIAGEVLKGYHETERMLLKGTHLVGIGRLVIDGNVIKLRPPEDGQTYILTKKSREEIISSLSHTTNTLKICLYVFGGLGCVLTLFLVVRLVKKLIRYIKDRRMQEQLYRAREQADADRIVRSRSSNEQSVVDLSDDATTCVICLTNRREVVLLDCGHVCLCADCVIALPQPKKCPICRSSVSRFIPAYIA